MSQPEGMQPEGYQPDGFQPQYAPLVHSAISLSATVRSVGKTLVTSSFSYISGYAVALEFEVTDQDGQAVDITPDAVRFVITRGSTAVIDTDGDNATLDLSQAAQGKFKVRIADEDTADLLGTYRFVAEIEDTAGDKAPVARGFITFGENVLASAS